MSFAILMLIVYLKSPNTTHLEKIFCIVLHRPMTEQTQHLKKELILIIWAKAEEKGILFAEIKVGFSFAALNQSWLHFSV